MDADRPAALCPQREEIAGGLGVLQRLEGEALAGDSDVGALGRLGGDLDEEPGVRPALVELAGRVQESRPVAEGRRREQLILQESTERLQLGIDLVRCPVGDKYVMEELIARDLALGGEQSGHIIFPDFLFTGDGLVTALSVLEAMAASGRELADLAADLTTYPQVLVNVRVSTRADLREVPAVAAALARVEARLGSEGRLLVRYSGTEPLLRIMLEGQDQRVIEALAQEIAAEVRAHL